MARGRKKQSLTLDMSSRPQVGAVARELTRLICVDGLLPGDSLPSQATLRAEKGFHNNTLNPAMQLLVDSGVIRRKARSGTVVVDPEGTVPGLWRVGLGMPPAAAEQMFYAQLFHLLQVSLQAFGATVQVFMLEDDTPVHGLGFQHFPGLTEACENGQLDGFITSLRIDGEDWQAWHERGLEMVSVGAWEEAPAGVIIEQGRMVTEAVGMLRERGCERLAVVSQHLPDPGYDRFWHSFRQACGKAGLSEDSARGLHGGRGPAGGWQVAEQLLDMPECERPDGLIILDDRVATGLTAVLAPNSANYCPQIVVQTNLQAPLAFALPVLHFEVDIEALARRGAAMLIARLRNPQTEARREWLYPELHAASPAHMIRNETGETAPGNREAVAV
jgi:DNA-binding LacI/PurR family transcriptional regulator